MHNTKLSFPILSNPDVDLMDIYKNYKRFLTSNDYTRIIPDNSCLLTQNYEKSDDKYSVCDQETFIRRFNRLTNGMMNFFDWDGVVVAGGVVNLALSNTPLPDDLDTMDYDVDVFLYGVNEGEAKKIITKVYDSIKDIVPESACVKTDKAITLVLPKPYRHVQFVTTLHASKGDILHSFDLQSSKVLYDGKSVYTTTDGYVTLMTKTNVFSESSAHSSYVSRLYKYSKRGYRVTIVGFDKTKLTSHVYKKSLYDDDIDMVTKLILFDKFGKNYDLLDNNNSNYLDDVNFSRGKASGYNTVLYIRSSNVDDVLHNLKVTTQKILSSLKLKSTQDKIETPRNKNFKKHDLTKFPIYLVFDNIKLALIHENNYSPSYDSMFFLNGPTFSKTPLYDYFANSYNVDYLNSIAENLTKYINRNTATKVKFDDMYYDETTSTTIKSILFGVNVFPEKVSGRDELGRTYMQAAIMANNVDLVNYLLTKQYDITERLDDGMTPLHLAIRKKNYQIVKCIVTFMKKQKLNSVKLYDNNRCNPLHYAIMYGDAAMYALLKENLEMTLADVPWSMQFGRNEKRSAKRISKYICAAKLCMMYDKLDILDLVLKQYNDFNDFRYIFVDSDLTSSSTSDIIEYAVTSYNYEGLEKITNFFDDNDIDITVNVKSFCNAYSDRYNLSNKELSVLFCLEKCLRNSSDKNLKTSMASMVTKTLNVLFQQGRYSDILYFTNKWIPDIWTRGAYSDIHKGIQFNNIFSNKYVDTEKALTLFSAVRDSNWELLEETLPSLHYGMYLYIPDSNKTVLTICDSQQQLKKVLSYLSKEVKSKMTTYSKNISALMALNRLPLFDVDLLAVFMEDTVHRENAITYINKILPQITQRIFADCDRSGDYTNFFKLMTLISRHTVEQALFIDFESSDKVVSTDNAVDEVGAVDDDIDSEEEPPSSLKAKTTSLQKEDSEEYVDEEEFTSKVQTENSATFNNYNLTRLYPKLAFLENYVQMMDIHEKNINDKLCELYHYKNFDLTKYLTNMEPMNFYKFLKVYPDLYHKVNFLAQPHMYGKLLEDKNIAYMILENYKVTETSELLTHAMTWPLDIFANFWSYIREKKIVNDVLKMCNFDNLVANAEINRYMEELTDLFRDDSYDQLLTDSNSNTLLHSIVMNKISNIEFIIPWIKNNNVVNKFGKSVQDYAETSINNTSKYLSSELQKNYKLYVELIKKLAGESA